jgi:hypothetical protein
MSTRAPLVRAEVLPGKLHRVAGDEPPHASLPQGFDLGDPGRPPEYPTLLIVIADDSGSVIAPAGTDPLSNRYEEARRAFKVVARHGRTHELGAVIHFDTPTSSDVLAAELTRRGLRQLTTGLRVPPDAAGASVLGPSLHEAVRLARAYPEHRTSLLVLSDFQLFDPDLGAVLAELAAFPGDIHAVVLGALLPEGLLDQRVHITQIGYDDQPGAVARAVFVSLTIHRPARRLQVAQGPAGPSHRPLS